ncbi:putative uncharacterized protein NEXN-AS1 [Perognathus longimembris pacificus]|uniref:putative uncharacterized protein NEXN-AS1 n=1 Tax=Perognathus longimembris pacificus TaxID=214514 RepID=UPI0020193A80|nr:putative uncharacterized protein NEXN-AS1 [Perognathus longimembris pacificus]
MPVPGARPFLGSRSSSARQWVLHLRSTGEAADAEQGEKGPAPATMARTPSHNALLPTWGPWGGLSSRPPTCQSRRETKEEHSRHFARPQAPGPPWLGGAEAPGTRRRRGVAWGAGARRGAEHALTRASATPSAARHPGRTRPPPPGVGRPPWSERPPGPTPRAPPSLPAGRPPIMNVKGAPRADVAASCAAFPFSPGSGVSSAEAPGHTEDAAMRAARGHSRRPFPGPCAVAGAAARCPASGSL